jgi:hypothetical protein
MLFTDVIATGLIWLRCQLCICENSDRWIGRWHSVQKQQWPMDWPLGTKGLMPVVYWPHTPFSRYCHFGARLLNVC